MLLENKSTFLRLPENHWVVSFMIYAVYPITFLQLGIQSNEKTLSWENYKPLTMTPNGFTGRWILSFAYLKNKTFRLVADASCTWQSKGGEPIWALYNSNLYRDENFGKFWTANWALSVTFRLACTISIATCKMNKEQSCIWICKW